MSNTKVKLDLFFPQKGESMDNPLGKYERNQMIISSVTCMQNVTKKCGNSLGFSISRSESA